MWVLHISVVFASCCQPIYLGTFAFPLGLWVSCPVLINMTCNSASCQHCCILCPFFRPCSNARKAAQSRPYRPWAELSKFPIGSNFSRTTGPECCRRACIVWQGTQLLTRLSAPYFSIIFICFRIDPLTRRTIEVGKQAAFRGIGEEMVSKQCSVRC